MCARVWSIDLRSALVSRDRPVLTDDDACPLGGAHLRFVVSCRGCHLKIIIV